MSLCCAICPLVRSYINTVYHNLCIFIVDVSYVGEREKVFPVHAIKAYRESIDIAPQQ